MTRSTAGCAASIRRRSVRLCRLHYRSIHDSYVVRTDTGEFYFKVYRHGLRSREEVQAEVECLLHLRDAGVRAVEPVAAADGGFVLDFETVQGPRHGVLFRSVGSRELPEGEESDALNARLGEYLASVHRAWDQLPSPPRRWRLDVETCLEQPMEHVRRFAALYPVDLDFVEQVAERVGRAVRTLPRAQPGYGLCHGDVYGGNLRLDEVGRPVLLDFDFCGYGWRAADLSLYAWSMGLGLDPAGRERRSRRCQAFLEGYERIRPLERWERDAIPLFVPFRRVFNLGFIYVSMGSTWGDHWTRANVRDDIERLRTWMESNAL